MTPVTVPAACDGNTMTLAVTQRFDISLTPTFWQAIGPGRPAYGEYIVDLTLADDILDLGLGLLLMLRQWLARTGGTPRIAGASPNAATAPLRKA